jgi:peptidoglycan/xylan/chitin deacetylase (PgdA/CDA1 family)
MMKKITSLLFKILMITSTFLMLVSCTKGDFYLLGKSKMTLEVHSSYVEPGYYAKEGLSVTIDTNLDRDVLGTYQVTYTATVNEKVVTLNRTITVVDTTAPEITLVGNVQNIKCTNKVYEEEGFTAIDNLDGDLTSKVTVSSVNDGFLYRIQDSSGNLAELVRSFTMEDTQFPVLDLIGSDKLLISQNSSYIEYGASALDNCDDVSQDIKITSTVNTAVLGTYMVYYSVKDNSGNATVKTRTVEVTDIPQTIVYLTFDDGPSLRTLEVLDILKAYNVKGTFFVGKKVDTLKYIMTRAHDEGHTVALHAYSHTASVIYASTDVFFYYLYLVQDWVESATGEKSWLYRFPGGSSNTSSRFNPGIMTTLTRMVQEEGFHYFDWNVSSGDGSSTTTSAQQVANVLRKVKPGGTYVVLMHDSSSHTNTVESLPLILDYLQSIGAQVLPITMDTPQVHHTVSN